MERDLDLVVSQDILEGHKEPSEESLDVNHYQKGCHRQYDVLYRDCYC